jgi:hypothetical protein
MKAKERIPINKATLLDYGFRASETDQVYWYDKIGFDFGFTPRAVLRHKQEDGTLFSMYKYVKYMDELNQLYFYYTGNNLPNYIEP